MHCAVRLSGRDAYAPRNSASSLLLPDWQDDGWQRLPARRTEVDGDHEAPLSVQSVSTADRVAQTLEEGGWSRPPRWTPRTTFLWLLPSSSAGQLPVMAKFHPGDSPALSLEKQISTSSRLVVRFWPTSYQVEGANDQPAALWIGMMSLERLEQPAGMATLALTDQDFVMPTEQLAQALRALSVRANIKRGDRAAVLLVP